MQVFIAFLVIAAIVAAVLIYITNRTTGSEPELKKALTAERERSNIAQASLRSIAAGAAMPVLEANEALAQINQTYTKEISK